MSYCGDRIPDQPTNPPEPKKEVNPRAEDEAYDANRERNHTIRLTAKGCIKHFGWKIILKKYYWDALNEDYKQELKWKREASKK